jgi:hypothetical protein
MPSKVHLFAWAAPALGVQALPDHTWVTSYDNQRTPYPNIAAVVAGGEHFWYCWGLFRASGGTPGNPSGALGDAAGDETVASCLARPDHDCGSTRSARGTIFRYGRDGVCHQLANQVLHTTGTRRRAPLTVANARGYWWSAFRFGTYGLPDAAWVTKRDACNEDES